LEGAADLAFCINAEPKFEPATAESIDETTRRPTGLKTIKPN
jgi:hypothetical protein